MRLSGSSWSCTLLLAGHFGGVWATPSNNKRKPGTSGKSDYRRPSPWDRLFAQKKLGSECPVDHQLCPESLGGGCCPNTSVCSTNACLAAIETTVTFAHPKITEAPLFKRKLGSNKWDMIHKGIQGQKRDAPQCGGGYQSCAASLSGGCCPTDRICGTDSCYAASTLPATVCSVAGYVACGMAEGGMLFHGIKDRATLIPVGGCCPQSYVCQVSGCSPSAGVVNTETCGVNSYLCPESVGYGCCQNGNACGISACYATSATTFVFTETMTTTDAENLPHTATSTITTASTPTVPTNIVNYTGLIAKVTPTATAIPKTSPPSTSSSGGLTKVQLGGIIGGAVTLLAVLILATLFIILRLNKVVKATTASRSRTRTSSSGTRASRHPRPSASDLDAMSIDPFLMSPSEAGSRSIRYPSHPSLAHSSAHEVDGSSSSPPVFSSPFSPNSPPFNHYPRGYNPVPTSDSNSSSGYGRNPSVESTPPLSHNPNAGYFDISPDLRDQNLRFGHSPPPRRPSQHQRNYSDVSNQSDVSTSSSRLAELDAGTDGDRISSLQRALQGFGMSRISIRRKSSQTNPSPMTLVGGILGRHPEWGPGPNPGAVGLGHIPEAGESRVALGDTEMGEISLTEPLQSSGIENRGEQKMIGRGVDVLKDRRR
jgi:hypothetical protein